MMAHYIDAEKLKAEIERRKNQTERMLDNIVPIRRKDTMDEEQLAKIELRDKVDKAYLNGVLITLSNILSLIASLQQEQPDNEDIDKVAQELYEHLYELKRRNNVPTNLYDKQEIIDLWKAGIEYGRNHPKQEQREVDLEKEIEMYISSKGLLDHAFLVPSIARHFYGLRNRALEEAARHVYESWNGGTMDNVRRDMVELGKVLNARKE